jgi:hypothetical protein
MTSVNPLLESMLLKSPLMQDIRAEALADAERQEAELRAQIHSHDARRDADLAALDAERQQLEKAIAKARRELEALESQYRAMHHRYEMAIPADKTAALRTHGLAVAPLHQKLKEIAGLKAALGA